MVELEKASCEQVGLKEFFESIIAVSDKRFEDRYNSLEKLINKNSQESKEAVKSALDAQEKAVNVAMAASEKAVLKAEIAAEKRFDNFAENYNKNLQRISDDLKSLSESRSLNSGKDEGTAKLGTFIVSAVAVLVSISTMIMMFLKS